MKAIGLQTRQFSQAKNRPPDERRPIDLTKGEGGYWYDAPRFLASNVFEPYLGNKIFNSRKRALAERQ